MGWQETINEIPFKIVTGDGEIYYPKWNTAVKTQDYNVAVFDFVNTTGSYVDRRRPKARKFELEFYFDGEYNVEIGNNFELSSRNSKSWKVQHPYYGKIVGQPINLKQDNSTLNVTKFNISFIETLVTKEIAENKQTKIVEPVIEDVPAEVVATQTTKQFVIKVENKFLTKLKDKVKKVKGAYDKVKKTVKAVQNKINKAKKLVSDITNTIDTVINDVTSLARGLKNLILYPFTVFQDMKAKFTIMLSVIDELIDTINSVVDMIVKTDKEKQDQNIAKATNEVLLNLSMFGMAKMLITDPDNGSVKELYSSRGDVLRTIEDVNTLLDRYLATIERMQSETYTPNIDEIQTVINNMNIVVNSLFDIIFELKQEREYICEKDTNVILLTHRFYGLDNEDENMERLCNENGIGLNEIFNIKKGRKIIYYV